LAKKRILLCNLSEGKLGEDNSRLLGSAIITQLHLAAMRRAFIPPQQRTPFYLFVDEFQLFATGYFTRLLSGGRKFGLRVTLAQQSTAQIQDPHITQVILANTGTLIVFRTASKDDATLVLPQLLPHVSQGDVVNLPRYRFFIKLGATEPEAAFSGITRAIEVEREEGVVEQIRLRSRQRYAKRYKPLEGDQLKAVSKSRKTTTPKKPSIRGKSKSVVVNSGGNLQDLV
jgi:hypothetical protein